MVSSSLRLAAAAHLLRAATGAFTSFLSALPDEFAHAEKAGQWGAARHGYHVALTNKVFGGVLDGTGPLEAVAGRSDFADDRWSFGAPPIAAAPSIIVPPAGVTRETAIRALADEARALAAAIEALDGSRASLCVGLPWGVVSVTQMCEWSGGHTLRHLAQVGRELQQDAARVRPV